METLLATQLDYEAKPRDYFCEPRLEMLPLVPANCRRLLDVGCGAGGFGEGLKQSRRVEVWGVEPMPSQAAIAATKLDHVVTGQFDEETELPEKAFDCIVFNDVLEHMVAPELALRYAKALLSPGGCVVASIPNVRHLPVIWDLVVHAQWEYRDCGILDKTHLRFFTRSSAVKLFESEQYAIEHIEGINAYHTGSRRLWWGYRALNTVLLHKLDELKFLQFAVVARPVPLL
jgi:2-polyprenyl-3-methyl-5-hydroxy-6-metoxy-1,4-benzoquinol methylase